MDAILNNPFRILGIPTNSSDKEIAKRVSDLLIYAEMGKKVSYETDFPFLGELDRSAESIKLASKKIEFPENKIFYSLLWFDINDNYHKKCIAFLEQNEYGNAEKILEDGIFNSSPIVYYLGRTLSDIINKLNQISYQDYSIQIFDPRKNPDGSSSTPLKFRRLVSVKESDEFVEIREANCSINIPDKYQIGFGFSWPLFGATNHHRTDGSFRLGFIDTLDVKHFVSLSINGLIIFYTSDKTIAETTIDKSIFDKARRNHLSIQVYDKTIEVRLNAVSIFKIPNKETFKSSFLSFSGKQLITIEDFAISSLEYNRNILHNIEFNEKTFSYSKNLSLTSLMKIERDRKVGSNLLHYFSIVGNFLNRPYFITYAEQVGGIKSGFNLDSIIDKFIMEFYYSLYQLVEHSEEYAEELFYDSFGNLSQNAKNRVKEIIVGSKPYALENFIKKTIEERKSEPINSINLANDLKNEATYFFNWYSKFFRSDSLESKSISDKIGNEILECAIAYYNAIIPKTLETAKQSLKLMTWASDFAFNQALRNRINESISILLKAHPNTEYKIVDFESKDRTRTTRHITPKESNTQTKTGNVPPPTEKTTSKPIEKEKLNKEKTSWGNNSSKSNDASKKNEQTKNKARHIVGKILLFIIDDFKAFIGLCMILFVIVYYLFYDENAPLKSTKNQVHNNKPVSRNDGNYSTPKDNSNLNVDLSHYAPRQQQAEAVEESKWKGNKLNNGDSPYNEYFGKGIYDYNSECYLIFKNGYSSDAIVCLENTATGRTIRNEYIQAGTEYKMTNIPEGIYKVKTFSGNDWNPEKTMKNGEINGAFDIDLSFSTSDNPSDLIQMRITETGEGISYSTGEITLYTVSHGNMQQRNINSDEFFK